MDSSQEKLEYDKFTLCVFGKPGEGKTAFVGAAGAVSELSPVLHISLDNSHRTIESPGYLRHLGVERLDTEIVAFAGIKQLSSILDQLYSSNKRTMDGRRFRTLVLDNLSFLQQAFMNQQRGMSLKTWHTIKPPDQRHYMTNDSVLFGFLDVIVRELDVNLICTATERTFNNADRAPVFIGVELASGLARDIPGFFDFFGRIVNTGGYREFRTNQYLDERVPVKYLKARSWGFPDPLGSRELSPDIAEVWAIAKPAYVRGTHVPTPRLETLDEEQETTENGATTTDSDSPSSDGTSAAAA